MKELIVALGLIILGGFIVTVLVLGDTDSLLSASQSLVTSGVTTISGITFPELAP